MSTIDQFELTIDSIQNTWILWIDEQINKQFKKNKKNTHLKTQKLPELVWQINWKSKMCDKNIDNVQFGLTVTMKKARAKTYQNNIQYWQNQNDEYS